MWFWRWRATAIVVQRKWLAIASRSPSSASPLTLVFEKSLQKKPACCAGALRWGLGSPPAGGPGKKSGRGGQSKAASLSARPLSRARRRSEPRRRTARCGPAAPAEIPIRRPASVWRLPAYPQSVPVLQIRAGYSENLIKKVNCGAGCSTLPVLWGRRLVWASWAHSVIAHCRFRET